MKLGSGSLDDALNELQYALSRKGTPAARVMVEEANRRYRELHRYYLRMLGAADRGTFDRRDRRPSRRSAGG